VRAHVRAREDGQPAAVEEMRLTRPGFEAALNEISDDDRTIDWPVRGDASGDGGRPTGDTAAETGDDGETTATEGTADSESAADPAPAEAGIEPGGNTVESEPQTEPPDAAEQSTESAEETETPSASPYDTDTRDPEHEEDIEGDEADSQKSS